jgi:hypothetical protein
MTNTAAVWLTWLVNPAIVLGGVGLFVRLVFLPALKNLLRADLKPELDMLKDHDTAIAEVKRDTEANTQALAALAQVPVTLGRIEENVKTLMKMSGRRSSD